MIGNVSAFQVKSHDTPVGANSTFVWQISLYYHMYYKFMWTISRQIIGDNDSIIVTIELLGLVLLFGLDFYFTETA